MRLTEQSIRLRRPSSIGVRFAALHDAAAHRSVCCSRSRSLGCYENAQSQAAAPPPPVTVAQPVKRTVTDWDEFTGRFEAIQEVQVRARVGGFVHSVDFKDGAIVRAGDLLYIIELCGEKSFGLE